MRLRDYLPAAAVITMIIAIIGLSAYHLTHPIPLSQRVFVPEWTCTDPQLGEVCERTGPHSGDPLPHPRKP
jgi:hypothetical protein